MSTTKNTQLLNIQQNVEEAHKQNSNSNKELYEKTHIKDTPFVVIRDTEKGVSYGVMGKYRMTEEYIDHLDCIEELTKITWNRIIQVIMCLNHDQENLNKLINKINEQ